MPTTEVRSLADPARRSWDGAGDRPVRVHLWRGSEAGPVVLLSHGTGGAARDLAWLAGPLADAGFLVAAIDHHGHNYVDGYLPEAFARWWDRVLDLSFVLDPLGHDGPAGAAGAPVRSAVAGAATAFFDRHLRSAR